METQDKKDSLKRLSHGRRNVKFFDITGHTLVHPLSYNLQGFQKQIIMSAVFKNTLISLPLGLGMPFLASVVVFNFQRWFLNAKIVMLSQTKSCIVEQINALNSHTTLTSDSYSDLYGNTTTDNEAAWNKPIILSTPVKFLDSIKTKMCKVDDLILLIVYETTKVTKCQEYKEIMDLLTGLNFRVNVFIEGGGFSTKSLKQVIETFSISLIEFRNLSSPDVMECTFRSEIESVSLEISQHMSSIKDAFYTVYEKYGKLLKDARVINGNVASFTKNQIQKAREKFIKAPPPNMNKESQQNLLDGMTMCSFLSVGIEILHNWGVRSFYNYLFDENKDGELKRLIVKDEHLKNQMKLLNEYLKSNGKKMESLMSKIVHPKLVYLKNLILRSFSEAENNIEGFRILIFCSMDEIVDDIDRLISNLPSFIRHQCVKTKSKSFSNTNEYKEVVQNFNGGVINILAVNNLVEEISDLKANLIISLEPSKPLLRFSDPRFYRGPDKCFFVLTKGNEYYKFESLLNEKKNEQKSVDLPVVDEVLQNSPSLFPEGFNPDFEGTSVGPLTRKADQSGTQKTTIMNYLKPSNEGKSRKSDSIFNDSDFVDSSIFVPNNTRKTSPERCLSPPLFQSKSKISVVKSPDVVKNDLKDTDDFYYISPQPVPFVEQEANSNAFKVDDDSFDDLILDFSVAQRNQVKSKPAKKEETNNSQSSDKENFNLGDSDSVSSKWTNDMDHDRFKVPETNTKMSIASRLLALRDCAANLPLELDMPSSSPESITNSKPPSPVSKSSSVIEFEYDDIFEDVDLSSLQKRASKENSFIGGTKDNTRSSTNSRIDIVNNAEQTPLSKYGFKSITSSRSSKDNTRTSGNSRSSIDFVNETRPNPSPGQKFRFKERSLFGGYKEDARIGENSRASISVVHDTVQNPGSLQKNRLAETSLFDSSKDETPIRVNSRSSIDFVNETRLNPSSGQKFAFKKTSLFGSSKEETRIGENSRTGISVVHDTIQNPGTLQKNKLAETWLYESSKEDSGTNVNPRTSIDIVNETRPNPSQMQKFRFKQRSLFGGSKDDTRTSANPCSSIQKDRVMDVSLFENSKADTRTNANSRTSIDFIDETRRNSSPLKKSRFEEMSLFGNSRENTRTNGYSRTSVDFVDETRRNSSPPQAELFADMSLFENFKEDSRLSKHSRTNIDAVDDTRQNPVSAKSPIFSAKKSSLMLSKTNHVPLKDRSASIHFDSSFELDDDFTIEKLCFDKPPVEEKRSPEFSPKNKPIESIQKDDSSGENEEVEEKLPDTANIDDWDPDCDLFEDENAEEDIATLLKDPVSIKTSTPISKPKITPAETSPIVTSAPMIDLVSPRKNPDDRTNFTERKKPPESTSTLTELPKPNRSHKNLATTCDINISDNCRKKAISNSFFSNFSSALKQRCEKNQIARNALASTKPPKTDDDDSDDFPWMKNTTKPPEKPKVTAKPDDEPLFPWLKKSPAKPPPPASSSNNSCSSWLKKSPVYVPCSASSDSPKASTTSANSSPSFIPNTVVGRASCSISDSPSIAHSTPDFKKPGPFLIRSSASRSAHSSSGSDQKSVGGENSPEPRMIKKRKKKTNLKRNLAIQFIDNEAEVSSDASNDTTSEETSNVSYEHDSFIDDEVMNKNNTYSHYLKSIKSPGSQQGRFHIPVLSESKLRANVCSQMDYYDQTYQQDSFCVDDVEEQDSEYVPSVLTQMEDKLRFKTNKTKRIQQVSSGEDSSNEEKSNATVRQKKKHRKRIMCFSSSDSDDAK
ncbi:uncharacterized protein Fancm [Planococcus citri]|uniref:uncharacterized protein Fancm n=1 Tax=Planococcus citri TaxID=170843 RepID=UPI0031F7BC1D